MGSSHGRGSSLGGQAITAPNSAPAPVPALAPDPAPVPGPAPVGLWEPKLLFCKDLSGEIEHVWFHRCYILHMGCPHLVKKGSASLCLFIFYVSLIRFLSFIKHSLAIQLGPGPHWPWKVDYFATSPLKFLIIPSGPDFGCPLLLPH